MTKREWVMQCAQRLKRNGGLAWNMALQDAAWLANEQEANYGAPAGWQSPEDVADEETKDLSEVEPFDAAIRNLRKTGA